MNFGFKKSIKTCESNRGFIPYIYSETRKIGYFYSMFFYNLSLVQCGLHLHLKPIRNVVLNLKKLRET